jgi:hypothetical protein
MVYFQNDVKVSYAPQVSSVNQFDGLLSICPRAIIVPLDCG